ncbi:MAG TPA: methyltransferase domain-containing protein [Anaeromyxobacter sp.]|nr:methyltransferase domain-containing protein [Anaeromyxobacter sp.]
MEDPAVVLPTPGEPLEFTGERFVPGCEGEIEHEHYHRYLFARELAAGRDVLDVASGEGYGAALLAGIARSVVGVELDPEIVAHAARSYAAPNLHFRVGRCEALPLESASVDLVVSFETLEHFEEQRRFLAEVKRVLRPGGLLVLSSPVRGVYSLGNPNPFHVRELSRGELEALVRSEFRHLVCLGQTPVVGSALLADEPLPPAIRTGQLFWRRDDGSFNRGGGTGLAPYLVVVASDAPLPPLRIGLLHDHPYMARLLARVRDAQRACDAERQRCADVLAAQQSASERLRAELAARTDELRDLRQRAEQAAQPRGAARLWDSLHRRRLARRIATTGLFDAAYYRQTNPDLGDALDPIRHYVKYGAWGGRDPHPMFDTSYYLAQEPALVRRRENPLLHFARVGAAEGRRPHPRYSAEEYLRAARRSSSAGSPATAPTRTAAPSRAATPPPSAVRLRPRPIPGALQDTGGGAARSAVTLVATHVFPYPPRAGNEYRIGRMIRWLRATGHEVHLVVCPLPGEEPGPEALERAAREHPDLYLCGRDGEVLHATRRPEALAALRALAGTRARTTAAAARGAPARLASIERTFCPDPFLELVARLAEALRPDVLLANYVFTSAVLAHAPAGSLRVIDTHDVFSTKARKVVQFGVPDDLALTGEEEAALLRRADLLVAIQPEEERELRALVPDRAVVTAGVDFEVAEPAPAPRDPIALYVGSRNGLNVRGLRDFLALAWPLVRRVRPDARLLIAGPVCDAVEEGVEGVELLGRVERLEPLYARARVVVNPAAAGTGLKIKTVEALSNLRPVVAWPSGVDGLGDELAALCAVATDWSAFARKVLERLDAGAAGELVARREHLARRFSPEHVYAALRAALARGVRARLPRAARPAALHA